MQKPCIDECMWSSLILWTRGNMSVSATGNHGASQCTQWGKCHPPYVCVQSSNPLRFHSILLSFILFRGSQAKALFGHRITVGSACAASVPKAVPSRPSARPKPKQSKVKAEPPPKKRRRWKEEFSPSPSESSLEALSEDDGEFISHRWVLNFRSHSVKSSLRIFDKGVTLQEAFTAWG